MNFVIKREGWDGRGGRYILKVEGKLFEDNNYVLFGANDYLELLCFNKLK